MPPIIPPKATKKPPKATNFLGWIKLETVGKSEIPTFLVGFGRKRDNNRTKTGQMGQKSVFGWNYKTIDKTKIRQKKMVV